MMVLCVVLICVSCPLLNENWNDPMKQHACMCGVHGLLFVFVFVNERDRSMPSRSEKTGRPMPQAGPICLDKMATSAV